VNLFRTIGRERIGIHEFTLLAFQLAGTSMLASKEKKSLY
jgi:hypothetical protein